jgi:hypothetical protein
MKLIFKDGEKLYKKDRSLLELTREFAESKDLTFYHRTLFREFFHELDSKNSKYPYNIYGDDFKIGITPRNPAYRCNLNIKDYDENQKFESEINIDFNKEELGQFISLLQDIKDKM